MPGRETFPAESGDARRAADRGRASGADPRDERAVGGHPSSRRDREPLDQPGTEVLEIHRRLEDLGRVFTLAQPLRVLR